MILEGSVQLLRGTEKEIERDSEMHSDRMWKSLSVYILIKERQRRRNHCIIL